MWGGWINAQHTLINLSVAQQTDKTKINKHIFLGFGYIISDLLHAKGQNMLKNMRVIDKQDYEDVVKGYKEIELIRLGGFDAKKMTNEGGEILFVVDGSCDNLLIIS